MTTLINCYSRRIHVTSNIILRNITFRNSSKDVGQLCTNGNLNSSLKNQSNSDYFGIDSEEGVITVQTQKHSSLETSGKRSLKEKFHNTAFGVVRYDSENKLKYHGQYNKRRDFIFPYTSSDIAEVQKDLLTSTIDNENQLEEELNALPSCEKMIYNNDVDILKKKDEDVGFIDEYYFGTSAMNSSTVDDAKQSELKDLSFIDQEYFKTLDDSCHSSGDIRNFSGKIMKDTMNDSSKVEEICHSSPTYERVAGDLTFFDENYFQNVITSDSNVSTDIKACISSEHPEPKDLNLIVQEYFKTLDDVNDSSGDTRDVSGRILKDVVKDSLKVEEISRSHTHESAADDLHFFDQNFFKNFTSSANEIPIDKKDCINRNDLSEVLPNERYPTLTERDRSTISESSNTNAASLTDSSSFDRDNLEKLIIRKDKSELNNLPSYINNYKLSSADQNDISTNLKDSQNILIHDSAPSSDITNVNLSKNIFSEKSKNSKTNFKYQISSENIKYNVEKTKEVFQSVAAEITVNTEITNKVHGKATKVFSEENNNKLSEDISNDSEQDSVQSAHDFVQALRKEQKNSSPNIAKRKGVSEEKTDSKGFRILKNQVQDLSNFTQAEILHILKQNIVYSDENLLVLNKPYSLVIHESETTKNPCLSMVLNELAKEMDKNAPNPKLFTVHRLDKETTGCLLLARNDTMAQHLKYLFAERKIIKKYWIITTRVPDPTEGVIDIPITEGSINNRKRMVLSPNLPKDIPYRNHSRGGKPAITSYQVISESGNAALVEATPVTGIKHQIRVHFGFGLGCPILGDHKYSHLDKLAPQKLPSDILQRLHVRQSKVRYIPMHIHAKSVIIPSYFERRDLIVHIPLPDHMKDNLKRLKFKKK